MHTEVKNHNQMEKQNHVYESASSSAPSRCISYMPPALPVVVDLYGGCTGDRGGSGPIKSNFPQTLGSAGSFLSHFDKEFQDHFEIKTICKEYGMTCYNLYLQEVTNHTEEFKKSRL